MKSTLQAIRYRNLDQAREVLQQFGTVLEQDPFDDQGKEPEGLLAVVTEDLVGEEAFYRLLDAEKGTLVQVVRKPYSGYGPPALEPDYMGFVSRKICYVLDGAELAVEIEDCPLGAKDLHHLEALVMDGQHPLDQEALARELRLPSDWDFDDLFDMIEEGSISASQIDRLTHEDSL